MESQVKQLHARANSATAKFKQGGGKQYIDQAIAFDRKALALFPPHDSKRSHSLTRLSIHLLDRYNQHGEMTDVDEAIVLGRDALALCPPGHQDRPMSLNNVALYIFTRYKRLGAVGDLNEAIVFSKDALVLCPLRHPSRAMSLINVATHLFARYKRLGGMEDLNKAVILARDALTFHPPGHPKRPISLNSVAIYLFARYKQLRALDDLNEAITLARDALALRTPGHSDRPTYLNNVALYLSTRYKCLGELNDLDEAIVLGRGALALRPPGHPDRSTSLNNVAADLSARYKQLKEVDNLHEAIVLARDALTLRPPGHPDRSTSLNNVALYLSTRYKCLGGKDDLDEAIVLGRDALGLHPLGHPLRSSALENLARYLHIRFNRSSQLKDKEELFSLCVHTTQITQTVSYADLSAARAWIHMAEHFQHPTTLQAYDTFLRLLTHHLATLPSLPQHLNLLKDLTSSFAVDAFSACLRNFSPTSAVELLEQGRGVFWSQLTRLRSPLDDVRAAAPTGEIFADKFTHLTSRIRSVLDSPASADRHDRVCRLNVDLHKVVTAIRELPSLSRFLLPSLFSDLQKAASEGPIIIVNASEYGCDALVVLPDRHPVHIPLRFTRQCVRDLSSKLHAFTATAKIIDIRKRLAAVLRELWDKVVSPIVDFLLTIHPPQSRIWWCPTAEFSLLPLHAADPYRKGQQGLADLYISSYTPTLTALIRARRYQLCSYTSEAKRFVAIGQAKAAGESELHSVGAELASIGRRVAGLTTFTCIQGIDSHIGRVAEELNKNQWVHLACHGLPNQVDPFRSAFALFDGHFTIERIIRCELQNAQFAYLSACHTTVGDEKSPDEMIHLASAMQFAGFPSVIGTMWAVDDAQTEKMSSMFYDHMVDESGRLDHTRAASALHKTIKEVDIPFDQRILYVHIGV